MGSILNDFRLDNCCGCGACISVCPVQAISYSKDKYEFTIPKVDENKCISCGKCISVCPLHSDREHSKVLSAYAAINRDEHTLMHSSSGGIFGAIAELVLRDGGVVYGVAMGDNFYVHHIRVDKISDLQKIQRSKYVQSYMGDVFTQITADIKNEKKVLFAGTPCQVESIRLYVQKNKLSSEKLLLLDIVCHGVPSQAFFNSYIVNMQQKKQD